MRPWQQYIEGTTSGSILAPEQVRQAYRLHLSDLERSDTDASYPWVFRPELGEDVIEFFRILRHTIGEKAGEPFYLEPWEQAAIVVCFGWVHRTGGYRRFKFLYLEIPRKNGKTALGSGLGLYMTVADGEAGARCYSFATKRDQAKLAYEQAEKMVKASKPLQRRISIYTGRMISEDTDSRFEPLGADADTTDGLNIHFGLCDELHAWTGIDTTGTGLQVFEPRTLTGFLGTGLEGGAVRLRIINDVGNATFSLHMRLKAP
jgi:phage terminase large subunit-like protein